MAVEHVSNVARRVTCLETAQSPVVAAVAEVVHASNVARKVTCRETVQSPVVAAVAEVERVLNVVKKVTCRGTVQSPVAAAAAAVVVVRVSNVARKDICLVIVPTLGLATEVAEVRTNRRIYVIDAYLWL